ncbi:MAG: Uncharacterized protein FD189_1092 [Elusimicrobia bacterium]|nr:MAG: Uncharacterized protein FD189_1092 [Elusimicrobiota bacterium]
MLSLSTAPSTKALLGKAGKHGAPTPLAGKTAQDAAWDSGAAAVKATGALQGITSTAKLFGTSGNLVVVELVAGAGLALSEAGTTVTVTLNSGVSTTAQVAAKIAAESTLATAAGGDATVAVPGSVTLTGGVDDPFSLPADAEFLDVSLSQAAYVVGSTSAVPPAANSGRLAAGCHRLPCRYQTYLHYRPVSGAALPAVGVSAFPRSA